jgi:hypothetical protein
MFSNRFDSSQILLSSKNFLGNAILPILLYGTVPAGSCFETVENISCFETVENISAEGSGVKQILRALRGE